MQISKKKTQIFVLLIKEVITLVATIGMKGLPSIGVFTMVTPWLNSKNPFSCRTGSAQNDPFPINPDKQKPKP